MRRKTSMPRPLLNELATRFASLDGVASTTEHIYRLLWTAYDLAVADDLDASESALQTLVIALEQAENEVGVGAWFEAAVVPVIFGPPVLLLKRREGDA